MLMSMLVWEMHEEDRDQDAVMDVSRQLSHRTTTARRCCGLQQEE